MHMAAELTSGRIDVAIAVGLCFACVGDGAPRVQEHPTRTRVTGRWKRPGLHNIIPEGTFDGDAT